jgi:hypothetical protein
MHLAPCLATPAGRQDPASDNAPTRRTRIHAGPIARLPLAQLDHPSRRSPALPLADTTLDHQALSQQPLTHAPRFGPVAAWNLVQPRGRPPEPTTLRSTWWGRVVEPWTGARNPDCDRIQPAATRSPRQRVEPAVRSRSGTFLSSPAAVDAHITACAVPARRGDVAGRVSDAPGGVGVRAVRCMAIGACPYARWPRLPRPRRERSCATGGAPSRPTPSRIRPAGAWVDRVGRAACRLMQGGSRTGRREPRVLVFALSQSRSEATATPPVPCMESGSVR